MNGFIFLCNNKTEQECLNRLLVGTNPNSNILPILSKIVPGDYVFLYNYSQGRMRGPFVALTTLKEDLEPNAWIGRYEKCPFPWQVRVSADEDRKVSLGVDQLSDVLQFNKSDKLGELPQTQLAGLTLSSVLERFRSGSKPSVEEPETLYGYSYIFKCDELTSPRCFDLGMMGAPAIYFRETVSRITIGSSILLWHIEKQRLFGVWRSIARGQYDPTAFSEHPQRMLHAVVRCERSIRFDLGLKADEVRDIVEFQGQMPPLVIRPDQLEALLERFMEFDSPGSRMLDKHDQVGNDFLTEDGHRVRSQGELIIDNMLYSFGIPHAYEKRVQVGSKVLRCDFFIPKSEGNKEVYIEYWGGIGDSKYDARRDEKLKIYKAAGITPLEIFPRDLKALPEVWPAKIRHYEL